MALAFAWGCTPAELRERHTLAELDAMTRLAVQAIERRR